MSESVGYEPEVTDKESCEYILDPVTGIMTLSEAKTDSVTKDADRDNITNIDENIKTCIDENVQVDDTYQMPLVYHPANTHVYHERIDENTNTLKGLDQTETVSVEQSNIREDVKSFDVSIGHKGYTTQDPTHTVELSKHNLTDEHTNTKTQDETVLLHSPQKEIDEEIPYHTPIIIEHTKDSSYKSVDVKSDVQNVYSAQNIPEKSHNISHIIEENKTSQKREDRDISSIERKHDIHTPVLSVSHIHAEQVPYPIEDAHKHKDIEAHKQTEPNTCTVKTVGQVRTYSSRDPRLQAFAERTQEIKTYREQIEHKSTQDISIKTDLNIPQDTIPHTSISADRQDRPFFPIEHKTYEAKRSSNKKDSSVKAESKIGHTELNVPKDASSFYKPVEHKDIKDVSALKNSDTLDKVTFKTPVVPEQDSYHIGHKMHEIDTYPIHKEDTLSMSYKGPIGHAGHETSTYTTVGHKKHFEDTNPYGPFGYMGHKDISSYSQKPTDSYSVLERKQELDAYGPKQIEQYPNIHTIEHKKQAKSTPYHNVSHTGLIDPDPYQAPVTYEPNAYPPMGQTGHVEHDPNYPMGHPRHIEHDPYSFGHMAPVDTLYNPFDHYAFDQEPFGYMGHLADTKHAEQDVRDTSAPYGVGHMDTFQAMEQSRHVLEDTETRTDTQGHETSPTHMLL